jgi:V8-like Glu-specific endopeptidase
MGSRPSKSAVKIDFREHLKTQKEVVFEQEVTKGARPVRGRAKQSGERSSTIFHINHETLENRPHPELHFHHETSAQSSNIRNPKARGGGGKLVDNRSRAAADKYPFCCIGLLQVQFENRRIRGTAFLISSNWLLTCAHNFYDRGERRMGSHATFTLGLEEREEVIRENGKEVKTRADVGENIDISAWRIPDQYITGPEEEAELYDFALVKLKNFHNLEEKYGYFGLDSVWSFQRAQTATELIVAGYPREVKGVAGKCKALIEGRGQWTEILNEETVKKSERLLYVNYQVYTSAGQSGSPIFYETKEREYFMVGIHTLGGDEENSGILVTPKTR